MPIIIVHNTVNNTVYSQENILQTRVGITDRLHSIKADFTIKGYILQLSAEFIAISQGTLFNTFINYMKIS